VIPSLATSTHLEDPSTLFLRGSFLPSPPCVVSQDVSLWEREEKLHLVPCFASEIYQILSTHTTTATKKFITRIAAKPKGLSSGALAGTTIGLPNGRANSLQMSSCNGDSKNTMSFKNHMAR
jgi:hypothetical protein